MLCSKLTASSYEQQVEHDCFITVTNCYKILTILRFGLAAVVVILRWTYPETSLTRFEGGPISCCCCRSILGKSPSFEK